MGMNTNEILKRFCPQPALKPGMRVLVACFDTHFDGKHLILVDLTGRKKSADKAVLSIYQSWLEEHGEMGNVIGAWQGMTTLIPRRVALSYAQYDYENQIIHEVVDAKSAIEAYGELYGRLPAKVSYCNCAEIDVWGCKKCLHGYLVRGTDRVAFSDDKIREKNPERKYGAESNSRYVFGLHAGNHAAGIVSFSTPKAPKGNCYKWLFGLNGWTRPDLVKKMKALREQERNSYEQAESAAKEKRVAERLRYLADMAMKAEVFDE